MAKPSVSRDAFRGLFAFYAAKAHHDHNGVAEARLLQLFGSSDHIPDGLLELWSSRTELIGPEAVGNIMSPLAHQILDGGAQYDHASDFLHRLLPELDRDSGVIVRPRNEYTPKLGGVADPLIRTSGRIDLQSALYLGKRQRADPLPKAQRRARHTFARPDISQPPHRRSRASRRISLAC
ncbi:hypothetical protein [Bradyrhizobium ottawaense]|uniref:hypothetical protein n=1 Tax=Bradyrhizobium ottawaense TaxID=931866 RepID=UPI0035138FB2